MNADPVRLPEKIREFLLIILFISIPFSIAGDDFAIIGLYLITIYLFFRKEEHWENTPILPGMVLLLAGAMISSLFSADLLNSLTYFRNFWRFGLPFLILFAFRNREPNRYLLILAYVSSLVGIYATIQFFTGLDLFPSENHEIFGPSNGIWFAAGFFSHHLTYGGVSLLIFSLLVPLVFHRDFSTHERVAFGIGSLMNLIAVVVNMGRSIWLGALVAIGILMLSKLTFKRVLYLMIAAILLISGLAAYQVRYDKMPFSSTAIGIRLKMALQPAANLERLMMWQAGVNIIKDHPWLGLGPKSGRQMAPYYWEVQKKLGLEMLREMLHKPEIGVHNIYIQNWINFGLIGFVGYLLWWLALLFKISHMIRKDPERRHKETAMLLGIFAGLIGCMVAGVFENNFRDGEVQTTILTLMGMGLATLKRGESRS